VLSGSYYFMCTLRILPHPYVPRPKLMPPPPWGAFHGALLCLLELFYAPWSSCMSLGALICTLDSCTPPLHPCTPPPMRVALGLFYVPWGSCVRLRLLCVPPLIYAPPFPPLLVCALHDPCTPPSTRIYLLHLPVHALLDVC
jgi:hypothetical protein